MRREKVRQTSTGLTRISEHHNPVDPVVPSTFFPQPLKPQASNLIFSSHNTLQPDEPSFLLRHIRHDAHPASAARDDLVVQLFRLTVELFSDQFY